MSQEQQKARTFGLDPGCSGRVLLAVVALLFVILVVTLLLLSPPSDYQRAQQQFSLDRAEALQPWTIALGIALRVVAIAAGMALLLALAAAARSGVRWLDTRSRLIHPDTETGQFPAVKVRQGEAVVDLNRLPDGKAMTSVLGGRSALLLTLFFRHVLGQDVPEFREQPAVLVSQPDTSPEQMQTTTQAQAVQALAAASRRGDAGPGGQAVQMLAAPPTRHPPSLPPLFTEVNQPQEVTLLLDAGKRQWDENIPEGACEQQPPKLLED